jgi:hypothetical protein
MNFTSEQYKLIFTAVRRYQYEKTVLNSKEYNTCSGQQRVSRLW